MNVVLPRKACPKSLSLTVQSQFCSVLICSVLFCSGAHCFCSLPNVPAMLGCGRCKVVFAALAAATAVEPASSRERERAMAPNLLFMMADQMRFDRCCCVRDGLAESLDRVVGTDSMAQTTALLHYDCLHDVAIFSRVVATASKPSR